MKSASSYPDPAREPHNLFVHLQSPNPVTGLLKQSSSPKLHPSVFLGPFSSVIGDVTIARSCFIAPLVSIRADEGTPFYIGEETNLQDGVILHGLQEGRVMVRDQAYSIYMEGKASASHGAIVHGPVYIGQGAFIGFQSLVFQAIVGRGVYIANNAVVTGKVRIADERFVPPGAVIDTQEKADQLGPRPQDAAEFAQAVQRINRDFSSSYSLMFGKNRCSCGLTCTL